MKVVTTTDEYTIFQKRNKRHAVRDAERRWVNGEEKVRILLSAGLIKLQEPKAPEAEPEPAAQTDGETSAGAEAAGEATAGE